MEFNSWKNKQLALGSLYYSNANCNKGNLVGCWKIKYDKKKREQRNIEFTLTFEEYLYKAFEAGLENPDQIGKSSDSFQLGR